MAWISPDVGIDITTYHIPSNIRCIESIALHTFALDVHGSDWCHPYRFQNLNPVKPGISPGTTGTLRLPRVWWSRVFCLGGSHELALAANYRSPRSCFRLKKSCEEWTIDFLLELNVLLIRAIWRASSMNDGLLCALHIDRFLFIWVLSIFRYWFISDWCLSPLRWFSDFHSSQGFQINVIEY